MCFDCESPRGRGWQVGAEWLREELPWRPPPLLPKRWWWLWRDLLLEPCWRGSPGRGANSSALRCPWELRRMKDNLLQECLVSSTAWKNILLHVAFLFLSNKVGNLEVTGRLSLRTLLWRRTHLGKLEPALSCWPRLTDERAGAPAAGAALRAYAHSSAAGEPRVSSSCWKHSPNWQALGGDHALQKQERLLLGFDWLLPLGEQSILQGSGQWNTNALQWTLTGGQLPENMAVLCLVVSSHLIAWTLTDVLFTPFISCMSASPEEQEHLPFAMWTAVDPEWKVCVVPALLTVGAQKVTEELGTMAFSHLLDGRPEAIWCKLCTVFPSCSPSPDWIFFFFFFYNYSPMIHEGQTISCLRWRAQPPGHHTILHSVVSWHLFCELLTWPIPLSQHFWIIELLFPALLLWEFWISLVLF